MTFKEEFSIDEIDEKIVPVVEKDTVKDNDGRIDRVAHNGQHTCDKCIPDRGCQCADPESDRDESGHYQDGHAGALRARGVKCGSSIAPRSFAGLQ